MEKEYKRIVAKDLRLRPQELSNELKCYIKQFIPENNLTEELSGIIDEDSYEFVLHCLWNFRQK
jgi:hypothetical protein